MEQGVGGTSMGIYDVLLLSATAVVRGRGKSTSMRPR